MSPIAPNDALDVGSDPSPLPPRALDGGLELTPAPVSLPVIQPISLCTLGPCRNLHVLTQRIDAQQPLDGSIAPTRTVTSHTCYPAPGIEYDLTSEPVKECSRWSPITQADLDVIKKSRRRVTHGEIDGLGGDYIAFMKSWDDAPDNE